MANNDGGAAALAGGFPWDEPAADVRRAPDGTWTFDDVPDVPGPVAGHLEGYGRDWRIPLYGHVLKVRPYDFGPPAGVCLVVICEKYAVVYNPALTAVTEQVQGVQLAVVPALLAAP